jgi:competence protein ComGC
MKDLDTFAIVMFVFIAICIVLVITVAIPSFNKENDVCNQKGGTMIKTSYGWTCLNVEKL